MSRLAARVPATDPEPPAARHQDRHRIATVTPYDLPQQWAMALHRHPQRIDGLLHMSRHLNDRQAAVVFSRAESKLGTATYAPLMSARSIHSVISELRISFDL